MNTAIIKKETANEIIHHPARIARRITGITSLKKNDVVTLLREENDSLYEEYLEVIKRNIELRAIVEKQQKLINAIYNAELNLIFPAGEESVITEVKTELPQLEQKTEAPVVKIPQPLGLDALAQRVCRLRKKQGQSLPTTIEKTKFLLGIYNAPGGIRCEELFASLGITRVTGMRYVSFFRKYSLVCHGGFYKLTDLGKKFVEGEPNPEWNKYNIKKWRSIR